jgi:hypothetical protein
MYSIRTTLEYLSRISAAILESGTKFGHQRVDKLMKQRAAELEEFRTYLLHLVLFGPAKIHLLNWVRYRQTAIGELTRKKMWIILRAYFKDSRRLSPVQDRLIQANLIRRNRFDIYSGIYRQKSEGQETRVTNTNEPAAHATMEATMPPQDNQPAPAPSQSQSFESTPQTQETPRQPATVGRSVQSSQPITEIAESFVVPRRPRKRETRSVCTKVSQGVLGQDYPKCPGDEGENFWCPYCAQQLDSSYSNRKNYRRWRYVPAHSS